MLRVAFNAVSLAPGGGLNGLIGYLRAWQEIGSPMDLTLYASRTTVLDAVKAARPDLRIVPYAVDASAAKHYLLQQVHLGRCIDRQGADVVMTTQQMIGRCHAPQLVHHRNLKRFMDPYPWARLFRGGVDHALRDRAARKSLRVAPCNVFISDYLRREAERFVPSSGPRNYVVYNGLSESLLRAATDPASPWDGRPHLVAVQSEASHKDNPTLFRALRYVVDKQPDLPWELTVAGEGDWVSERQLLRQLDLENRVRFPGYLSHAQLDPILRQSVCLVFTSVLEGFGNPPIEAMARRCPTVACNVTAMPEVIGDAGVLVEPHRPDQFGQAILNLYHDRAYREGLVQKGLQRIGLFKWTDSASQMFALLEATAQGRLVPAHRNDSQQGS